MKESFDFQKNVSETDEELEQLQDLGKKREVIQEEWDKFFDIIQKMDSKYSIKVQFDENENFKSDRSFYSEEDIKLHQKLEEGLEKAEKARNEMDKQIEKMRFDIGLKHLEELADDETIHWENVKDHSPDAKDAFDVLYSKQWKVIKGNDVAEVKFSADKNVSMIDFLKKISGNPDLEKIFPSRDVPYNMLSMDFSYSSRWKKTDEFLKPGVALSKQFHMEEKDDVIDIHPPLLNSAFAYSEISEEERTRAEKAMMKLAKKLDIEYL